MSSPSSSPSPASASSADTVPLWHQLTVQPHPNTWLPPYSLTHSTFYFQLLTHTDPAALCLIVTDLLYVWFCRMDERMIMNKVQEYNPSLRQRNASKSMDMLRDVLVGRSNHQYHLVQFSEPQMDDNLKPILTMPPQTNSQQSVQRNVSEATNLPPHSPTTPLCILHSSMSLSDIVTFRFEFHLRSYGTFLDQMLFLREQMFKPSLEVMKVLSWNLEREKRRVKRMKEKLADGYPLEPSQVTVSEEEITPNTQPSFSQIAPLYAHAAALATSNTGDNANERPLPTRLDVELNAQNEWILSQSSLSASQPPILDSSLQRASSPSLSQPHDEEKQPLKPHLAGEEEKEEPRPAYDEQGNYIETEEEKQRREQLQRQLEAAKKKKKRKAFV